jgi:hypothetical protein
MNNFLLRRAASLLLGLLCYGGAMALNVSGTVWVDANNNSTVDAGETATNFGGPMFVNLVNGSGVVINSVQVGPNGAYTLTNVANNLTGHKLVLTNTATNINGNRVPGVYFVMGNVVGAGNTASQTGSYTGEINLRTGTSNIPNQNFRMGQQGTFDCLDGIAYQVAVPNGETVSTLYSYNVSSGVRTQIGNPTPYPLNSLIYSTAAASNILWGTVAGESFLVRIGSGSGTVRVNVPELATTNMDFNVGVELPNAYMLINYTTESVYYVIDVDPTRATYLEMVDPKNNYALKTGPNYGTTLTRPIGGSDIAYLASTGLVYSIDANAILTTLNPATGALVTNTTPVSGLPANTYGGLFSDKTNKLYAFNNVTGGFYKINPVTNTATLISTSDPSMGNDAASCPEAVVECDTDIPISPADAAICIGTTTTFTVAPDGNGPFTYQWEQSTNGGTTWNDMQASGSGVNGSISGGTTKVLTISPTTTVWNGFSYRCRVSSNLCVTRSSSATLTILNIPGAPTLLAATDAPICPATTYNLNRLISGTAPTGSNVRFYTSATPSPATLVNDPTVAPAGTYYARYENAGCEGPVSEPITILGCQTPFDCEDGVAYQVSAAAGETTSSLYAFNVSSGARTLVAPLSLTVNSLVYNTADNMLWATKNGSNSLVRIDANGSLVEYPIANMIGNFNVGAGLPNGYMLVYNTNQPTYYVVDIDPSRATYLRLVNPVNGNATNSGRTLTAAMNVSDIVYLPTTGLVYGIEGLTARLVSLNHVTGDVVRGGVVSDLPLNTFYGAVFADPTGRIYAFANEPGSFHRVNPSAGTSQLISNSVLSNSNDGASCPDAVLEILPFDCADGITYQVAAASGELVSSLYAFNINTGVRTLIAPLPMTVNALVYNSTDDMLWAAKNNSSSIVRIDAQGGAMEFPVPNLPLGFYNVGVELPNGYMLLYASNLSSYYVIDIDQSRATFLQMVDPTNGFAPQAGPTYGKAVSAPMNVADIAFLSSTQLCYGISSTDGRLVTFNPFTGLVTNGAVVRGATLSPFGAMFADATGKLYGFHNITGGFYKIDPATASASRISTSTPSSSNDGANCVTAVICDIDLTQPEPENQAACTGSATTFSVTATGTGTLTYQWQISTDGGTNWTNLVLAGASDANGSYSGAGTSVLTITPLTNAWNGNQYRVIVDSDSELCTLTSSAGNLTVAITPITKPVLSKTAVLICPDETVDLTTLVSSTTPSGTTLVFFTSATPSPATVVTDPTQAGEGNYYAFYSNGACNSPASDQIVVERDNDCDLPVTLTSFTVKKEGEHTAILKWATTAESNSDRFEIERSTDARQWFKIAEKASAGESASMKEYGYTDAAPAEGMNYYRLKMVDKDATFAYSRIQTAEFRAALMAYPNPASDGLKLKNYGQVKHMVIHNASGQKILERSVVTAEGVDISKLASGIYNVTLTLFDGSKRVQKIVVVR